MQNDGLDGIVVAKLLELRHHHPRIDDDTFQFHHADLVAEAVQRRFFPTCVQGQIHQRKHRQHEEEENSSPNHDPEQCAGTTILSHTSEGSLAPEEASAAEFRASVLTCGWKLRNIRPAYSTRRILGGAALSSAAITIVERIKGS